LGHFVTKVSLHIWNQHKILDFFIPIWPISRKFSPLWRTDFKICQHKSWKKIETPKNKEKCLFYNSLIYLLPIQNYMKQSNFQKFCQNHWTLIHIYEYIYCTYMCTYSQTYTYKHTETYTLHIHIHICTNTYTQNCACMYIHIHIVYVNVYVFVNVYVYIDNT
jgi:hypothetical protein